MANSSFNFAANVDRALADPQLRRNFKVAMGSMISKRKAIFPEADYLEQLRQAGQEIRQRALRKLPELLEQLEQQCTQNNIQVHWAETTEQANQICLDIIQSHQAQRIVKGKSMVSEEMHLNHFLEQQGLDVLETDLGEYIIQLDQETPSHIIVPAIHKNKQQIAKLFHEKIANTPYTEVVEELNATARLTLRQHFFAGEIGISGVNFAVAETGTLCLVENEGNGRMCTTLPKVHIALMGLEKVVEKLADVPPLLRLLTGSATGQLITTYFNLISGPRKANEKDGPQEVHLVILDNGRSRMYADLQLRQTLQCIRCGACLNHCPVYTRLGGHAYGHVYPGPIGAVLTPQLVGLEKAGVLATASSLCHACDEVCPVKIPLTDILRRLRNASYGNAPTTGTLIGEGYKKSHWIEKLIWHGWALNNTVPLFNRLSAWIVGRIGHRLPVIGPLKEWTRYRLKPRFAKKSLHQLAKEKGLANE